MPAHIAPESTIAPAKTIGLAPNHSSSIATHSRYRVAAHDPAQSPRGVDYCRPQQGSRNWQADGAQGDSTRFFKGNGGGRGIRTPGALSGTTVFKTAGFNRSPIPPLGWKRSCSISLSQP